MNTLSSRLGDHDLLIEIKTITKGIVSSFDDFKSDVSSRLSAADQKIQDVQKRVDWITIGGLISVITLILTVAGFIISNIVHK